MVLLIYAKQLRGDRHKRDKGAMAPSYEGDIEDAGFPYPTVELVERFCGVVEKGVDGRVGEYLHECLEHPFGASVLVQVIVDECDAH